MGGKTQGKVVCLISGGLDSAVSAAIAKEAGNQIYALTVDYGQRHGREIKSARKIAKKLGTREHKIIKLDLTKFGGSALTSDIRLPERKTAGEIKKAGIPVTYVPARNTIMLSLALAYAEVVGADEIFLGANHVDYSGYPDCRPEYFKAFQMMADLATKGGVEGNPVKIRTPIINMSKKEIIQNAVELGVPLEHTWSCYRGGEKACGVCDSCVLRLHGFREAGIEDPIEYD